MSYLYYSPSCENATGFSFYDLPNGERVKVTYVFSTKELASACFYKDLILVGMNGKLVGGNWVSHRSKRTNMCNRVVKIGN